MSYRSAFPFKVVAEVTIWQGYSPEQVKAMKEGLARLKADGIEAFSSKWFLDINISVCLTELNATIFKVKNPAVTPVQQKNSTYTLTGFPAIISGRIGIGLKL